MHKRFRSGRFTSRAQRSATMRFRRDLARSRAARRGSSGS